MAAFQKGQPRPLNAGRKPGSKNKKKVARVAEYLAERDINPAEKVLEIIHGIHTCSASCVEKCAFKGKPLLDSKEKLDAWLDLLSYCQAKPKAIEELPEDDDDYSDFDHVSNEDLLKLVKPPNGNA